MKRGMLMRGLIQLLSLCFAAVAIGCTGSETGNPSRGELRLGLQSSDDSIASELETPGALHVEQLWLSLESIALVGCDAGAPEVVINSAPFSGDLAQGLVGGDVPTGDYCGAHVRLVPGDLSAPAGLPALPATVAVLGTQADGVPFAILSAAPLDITLPGTAFAVHAEEQLLLAFDVSGWLRADVLGNAMVVDGAAVVDGREHPALSATFDSQVTVSLHRDENSSGTVDAGEPPLAGFH